MKKWLCLLILLLPIPAFAEELYPAMGDNGLWGYISTDAEWIIEPQYEGASEFRGNYAVILDLPDDLDDDADREEDYEGIIDRTGNIVVEPHYFFDGGYDGGYYGGKDTGIWVAFSGYGEDCREGFFDILSGTFSGTNWLWVCNWCTDSDLILVEGGYASRSTGDMVLFGDYDCSDDGRFRDGIAVVALLLDEENEIVSDYFLINELGETIPLPEGVQPAEYAMYAYDRVPVVNTEGLYGYANGQGEIVIPLQYADANPFCEGFAGVLFPEGDWGYIDVEGQVIARGFTRVYDFECGYGEVWTSGTNRYDQVVAWINDNGEFIPFMDGRFYPITHDRMWMDVEDAPSSPSHLVDGSGKILTTEPVWLPDYQPSEFAYGLQPACNAERKWGYINLDGEVVIPFVYDYAWDFDGSLARIGLGDREGYIDQAGNVIYMWTETDE